MGLIKKVFWVTFFAWLLVRIIIINKKLRIAGFGIPVFTHYPGPCKIFHVNGSEDIDVLPNGLAIISSGIYYELTPLGVDPAMLEYKGILYALDLNKPEDKPRPLSFENFDDSLFQPHGIDIYIDSKTQEVSLFVINHARGKSTIEIFDFDQENMVLKHRKTAADENIYTPNDVVAVGPQSFYTTNDRYFKNIMLGLMESFYPLKLGNVVFYNGSHAKTVADNFQFANGINIDKSGRYVFAVSGVAGEVLVYERADDNNLVERQRINIGMLLDNVDIDENGHLWLGIANMAILEYSANFSIPCPGKALQVKLSKMEDGKVPFKIDDIREVFSSDGKGEFKCVSTASFFRGKLLVGNPYSNLMYCEVLAM